MEQFNEENYEEALEYFMEARRLEPKSSVIAFYLGLTLRLMENHKEAIPPLRDAVTLTPRVKEALPELIDSLYQENELNEALYFISVGEKEGIFPAKLFYLKGLILSKQGKNLEAIEAFENAKRLDASLAQMVEFQIASTYLKEGRLKESRERFKTAISLDPKTDIGTYAREYENLVSDKLDQERPFRFTLGLGYKYDTNVNVRPTSGPFVDIPSFSALLSGQRDFALNLNFRAVYIAPFSFKKPYNLAIQYFLNADRYFRRDDYNSIQQNITLTPGYNLSRVSLMLPMSFGYSWLQGDNRDGFGSGTDFLNRLKWFKDAQYVKVYGINPMARIMLTQNTVGEVSFGLSQKRYDRISSDAPPIAPEENRDGTNTNGSLGWSYFYREGKGILSLRYTFANEDSDGFNWSYKEHRFSFSTIYPLTKALRGQLSLDGIFTNYKHENTTFGMKRRDNTFIGSFSLLYGIFKNTDIIAQYIYTRDKSNIGTYDYKREVFMVGVEFRF
ncbi:MAG: surface lipoprotein assembly modifier [Syntrophorhabdaceae bacterium]|nr:surface lipoprotein assembly modifier [Syntrophorhabdaceae bacterium]